jgi:hypothetical protein
MTFHGQWLCLQKIIELSFPDLIVESNTLQDELFRNIVKKTWIPWSSQGMTDFVTLAQVIATQPPGRIMTAFENTAY